MGELYIRTETMMLGYFNNDGMSGTLGDDEGWTSTGKLENVIIKTPTTRQAA